MKTLEGKEIDCYHTCQNTDELAISIYKQGHHYPTIMLLNKTDETEVMIAKNENDEKIYLSQQEAKGMLHNYCHSNTKYQYGIIVFEEKTSNQLIRITYYRQAGTYSTRVLCKR